MKNRIVSKREKDNSDLVNALQSPSERMLTSLLEDYLGKNNPPDLTFKVLAQLNENGIQSDRQRDVDWDLAMRSASNDLATGTGVVIPPPVVLNRVPDGELTDWIRRGIWVATALAASVFFALFIPNAYKTWSTGNNPTPIVKEDAPRKVEDKAPSLAQENPADRSLPQFTQPEVVSTNAMTGNTEKPKPQTPNGRYSPSNVAANAMKDSDVVSVIDSQLSYLWKRLGLAPTAEVQMDVWLDRTAIAILGRQATAAEKEAFRLNKSESKAVHFVDSLVSSGEFPRYWSQRLAEHYLGRRLRTNRDISASEQSFVDMLEEAVSQKAFVGEIERNLIAPAVLGNNVDSVVLKDASAFWLAETMERAASVQRELVENGSMVKKRDARDEAILGVSRQVMRLSGNPSLVCSQCHVDETGSSDLRGYIAMSEAKRAGGGIPFWNVPASLSGLNLVYKDSERTLRVEAAKEFFYEDSDGRMKLAKAGPPTLGRNASASESLGAWFIGSSEPRRALVDMVWNQVFQQPLVPAIGLSEDEGLSERMDLRDLLANQMQLRNADLGSLVRWVVLSKATKLEGLKTDANWYLKSPESQIVASQKQMRMFAGYPRSESVQVDSGKLSMNKVNSWIAQKRSFQKSEATLAQPGSAPSITKGVSPLKLDYSQDQVRYLISVEDPYSQIKAVSDRLAKSSMPWSMALEHVYLATDARFPTRSERDDATKLLETARNDRMKTIVMIVNARLGSW